MLPRAGTNSLAISIRLETKELRNSLRSSANEPRPEGLTAVIVRLDRTVQYAAAYRFHHWRLWNTGSIPFAGDDDGGGGGLFRYFYFSSCRCSSRTNVVRPVRRSRFSRSAFRIDCTSAKAWST